MKLRSLHALPGKSCQEKEATRQGKGREGKGREGKGREGKGRLPLSTRKNARSAAETLDPIPETRQMVQECIYKAQEKNRRSKEILRGWQQPIFQVGLD